MKRFVCIILIATIMVGGIFFVETTHASTVKGTINVNTHWTQNDSPITFNGTVSVANGVTLMIDPGVTVNLGMYGLFVSGTLNATGDPGNEIIFTASSINNFTKTNVNAAMFFDSSSASWNDASNTGSIVQNAILNQIYLQINGASPKIDNCQFNFQTPYQSTISISGGSPIISNNIIVYNAPGNNAGASCLNIYGGAPQITNNRFQGAYSNYSSSEIKVNSGTPSITNNLFDGDYHGSSNNGISVSSGNPIISNNQFKGKGCLTAILDSSSGQFTIFKNTFSNCNSGITAQAPSILTVNGNSFLDGNDGIDIIGSASLTITNNLIDRNSRFGISGGGYIDSNTITNNQVGIHNPPSGTISNNNIVGNTLNSIDATTADVIAQNNWWGIIDIPTINQTIYDSKVDQSLGTVSFVPFLTQPSPTAPAIPATTPVITPAPTVLLFPQPATPIPTPIDTPTPTISQYSQTFIYQVGSIFNLNMIVTATALILVFAWVIALLFYGVRRGISRINQEKPSEKVNS